MTPSQRLSAIAKVLDEYANYYIGPSGTYARTVAGPQLEPKDFTKLKQLANPKKSKRKQER